MCTKTPSTVDYETDNRGHYLEELESCLKRFNGALTMTMNSYRDLLSAFDKMAQVFGNLAGDLKPEVKDPIIAMRDGMRDLKDKGPFVTFNSDVHEGTISVLDPLRVDLKKAQKSLTELKSKQKDYDSIRAKVENKEKEYAKKDKPLKDSESYKKDVEKRNKAKIAYESKREGFEKEIASLKSLTESVLLTSMNNYLHCTSTFAGYLEATMDAYRTDIDAEGKKLGGAREIKMDRVKQDAERRSVTMRRKSAMNSQPSTPQASATFHNEENGNRSPAKSKNSSHHSGSARYPSEPESQTIPNGDAVYPVEGKNPFSN